LRSGKHVYSEKPFALDREGSARVCQVAHAQGLLVGSAPDTILGGGLQTARAVLDAGRCGRPVAALAFLLGHGHESWHPAPAFYYQKGGGPLFDMGPYYLTALVHLLGPAVRVAAIARQSFPERLITSQPMAGTKITVEVPTHYSATVEFANGAAATVVMSFDVWPGPVMPRIVVFGSEATLEVPDPNRFDGEVRIRMPGQPEAVAEPATHASDRGRGTGVADLAYSIRRREREFRTEAGIADHVLEIMVAIELASASGRHVELTTTCSRPPPLPSGLPSNVLDA
jgi:predicted dehydrogenase